MKRILILGLILTIVFVSGCVENDSVENDSVVCNSPYIQVGSECCLDSNDNRICDYEEERCTLHNYEYSTEIIECHLPRGDFPGIVKCRVDNIEDVSGEFEIEYGFRLEYGNDYTERKTISINGNDYYLTNGWGMLSNEIETGTDCICRVIQIPNRQICD